MKSFHEALMVDSESVWAPIGCTIHFQYFGATVGPILASEVNVRQGGPRLNVTLLGEAWSSFEMLSESIGGHLRGLKSYYWKPSGSSLRAR